jgi:hypothetical protein
MKYFTNLPKIIRTDEYGYSSLFTDLTIRATIKSKLLQNPMLYYTYDIKEDDTPEIIAHKYYNDPYRFWIVLLANEIIDPQWDWPMNGPTFERYIDSKYTNVQKNLAHHYEKIISTYDFGSGQLTKDVIIIDDVAFDALNETESTYSLPTGDVKSIITKRVVTNYDYESELNDSKRNIKILNVDYVYQIEKEFKNLMSTSK